MGRRAPPRVDEFPSFSHVDPSAPDFRCVWPLVDKGRSCRNPIAQKLRDETSLIRDRILDESLGADRAALLQTFAENCCCKGIHRKRVTGTILGKELCQRWERDLEGPLSTPVVLTPIIIPPSTSESHASSA